MVSQLMLKPSVLRSTYKYKYGVMYMYVPPAWRENVRQGTGVAGSALRMLDVDGTTLLTVLMANSKGSEAMDALMLML
jgi:hypothetical protein